MNALTRIPDHSDAKLPATYEAARSALAECYRIDECQQWADKMAALKSYAKQSEDKSLYDTAARIQGRAVWRLGELLTEIEAPKGGPRPGAGRPSATESKGGRPSIDSRPSPLPSPPPPRVLTPRQAAIEEAGLSRDQAKQAIRVANIPAAEFEAAIESPKPPTVTELADRGKRLSPRPLHDLGARSPVDFRVTTDAIGFVRDLHDFALRTDPQQVARGASDRERLRFAEQIPPLLGWLSELAAAVVEKSR